MTVNVSQLSELVFSRYLVHADPFTFARSLRIEARYQEQHIAELLYTAANELEAQFTPEEILRRRPANAY